MKSIPNYTNIDPICTNIDPNKCQKRALFDFIQPGTIYHPSTVKNNLEKASKVFHEEFKKNDECKFVALTNCEVCMDQALRYLYELSDPESINARHITNNYLSFLESKHDFDNIIHEAMTLSKGKAIFVPAKFFIKTLTKDVKGEHILDCEEFISCDKKDFLFYFYSMNQIIDQEPEIRKAIKDKFASRKELLLQLIESYINTFEYDKLDEHVQKFLREIIIWWARNILDIEWPFYSIEDIYRDHTYHSLRIGYLGNSLLHLYLPAHLNTGEPIKLIQYLEQNNNSFNMQEIRWGLFFSALFHDIGMMICKPHPNRHKRINEQIGELFNASFEWKDEKSINWVILRTKKPEVWEILKKALDFFNPRIKNDTNIIQFNATGEELRLNRKFHGLAGASLLLSGLSAKCEHNVLMQKIFLEIVGAIAFHDLNTDNIDKASIKLSEHPIGFFLKLIDDIQEWGRFILRGDPEIRHDTPLWRDIFLKLDVLNSRFFIPKDSLTFLIDYSLPENLYYFNILKNFWD